MVWAGRPWRREVMPRRRRVSTDMAGDSARAACQALRPSGVSRQVKMSVSQSCQPVKDAGAEDFAGKAGVAAEDAVYFRVYVVSPVLGEHLAYYGIGPWRVHPEAAAVAV